jgi:nucleoside-diphosphate-sugar epimerase
MNAKVVLVTGAGGFIGRWSVPPLLAAGFEVHAVAGRGAGRALPEQLTGAIVHNADLLDAATVEALIDRVRPSHLLHFAWIAKPGIYWTSPENYQWVDAGVHLLQRFAAAGGRRAVMAGSSAEYDWTRVGVCNERASPLADARSPLAGAPSPLAGPPGTLITPYAECKISMQRAMARVAAEHGLSTAWGRIFFQFGPDEDAHRLVSSVIVNLLRGREAPCSHGRQIRSFLHVADVGAAFAALLQSAVEGPVNVGSESPLALADLLQRIGLQIGRPELVKLGARDAPPGEPPLLIPDVGRLQGEVGWRPRFGLENGLADTIAWWRHALARGAGADRYVGGGADG